MKRGERRSEEEWRGLILEYLKSHENENNTISKIANGVGTTPQTATKYIYLYLGLGWIESQLKVVNMVTFRLTNIGSNKLEEGNYDKHKGIF